MRLVVGGCYEFVGAIEADILAHLSLGDGQLVVDVGCGSERLPSVLRRRMSIDYLGTDILPLALHYERKHAPAHYRFVTVEGA